LYYILYSKSYLYNALLGIQLMNFYKGNALYTVCFQNNSPAAGIQPPFYSPHSYVGVGHRPTAVATAVVGNAPLRALRRQTLYNILSLKPLKHRTRREIYQLREIIAESVIYIYIIEDCWLHENLQNKFGVCGWVLVWG